MGIIDNLMNVMRLNPEDEEEDYMDEDYDDEPEPEEKKPRKGLFSRKQKEEVFLRFVES